MTFSRFPRRNTLAVLLVLALPAVLKGQTPLAGEAYTLAEKAYQAQQAGNLPAALKATEAALKLAPGDPDLRRMKLDLLMTTDALPEAAAWAEVLLKESPGDARLHLSTALLRQRQGHTEEAVAEARQALALPSLAPEDQAPARLTLADLLLEGRRPAEALEALAPLAGMDSYAVQSRLGYARLGAGQAQGARTAFRTALAKADTPEAKRGSLAGLLDASRQCQDPGGELEALLALRALAPGDRPLARDAAYALSRAGRDREALAAFQASFGPESGPSDYLDAAYSAKRAGLNREARNLFARSVESQTPAHPMDPVQLFGVRREGETLARTWGGSLSASYNQGGILPGLSSSHKTTQIGAEVYYQPEWSSRDGRMLQFYADGFENAHDNQGGATWGPTLQPSLGVRIKPLGSQNLVLGVQRLFQGGRFTLRDWLVRAAYSLDQGTDLQPASDAWATWQVYTEAGYFLDAERYIQTLEGRWGGSWKLAAWDGLVATPHLVLAGDYDSKGAPRTSLGIGPGVALRQWFRQSRTQAPASWAELSIQYRAKLTEAERGKGLFVRLSLWF
jgi:tetratricopeptide (TPR) repeat protein